VRVDIRSPGTRPETILLEPGQALLVGRNPNSPSVVNVERPTPAAPIEHTLTVPSASISSHHLLIVRDADAVRVEDLGSRNGTWVKLPPRTPVQFPPTQELSIQLALPKGTSEEIDLPADFCWTNDSEYADALTTEIGRWFQRRDFPVRLSTVLPNDPASGSIGRLPLGVGRDLIVQPLGTTGAEWFHYVSSLERFVARQNLLLGTQKALLEDGLIVSSKAIRATLARVVDAAQAGSKTLLLLGPSGSGKDGMARCFHRQLARPGPFVAKNCSTLNAEFARSDLFGAERGAFTGSVQRINGAVERANEGTLFLDELGELPTAVQPMLLRFLDHGEYERVGHRGPPCFSDVRFVGATNRDLRAAVVNREFRDDLWFRLSAQVVDVPPLSQRADDLSAFLMQRLTKGGASIFQALSPGALELVQSYAWPGNFRELGNFADRVVVALAPAAAMINADLCKRLLEEGALTPLRMGRSPHPSARRGEEGKSERWGAVGATATAAFAEDHAGAIPRTWDDVKLYVENYLKPLLFAEMAELDTQERDQIEMRSLVDRIHADRGTISKQVARYYDRFVSRN